MTFSQVYIKRIFDILLSVICLFIFLIPIILLIFLSTIDTKELGIFLQTRVGQNSKLFKIIKIKTLNRNGNCSEYGKFIRKIRLDETTQLINILIGQMSFVGPRPDIVGFADKLVGDDRVILTVRPGLTGPATLKFYNENDLLINISNPKEYNRKIIWPQKIILNKEYVNNYHIFNDIKYIVKTIINVF